MVFCVPRHNKLMRRDTDDSSIFPVVDDAPWHWAETSGEPVILVGLPAGKHKVTIIVADPTHKPIDHKTVEFTVPPHAAVHHF